MVKPQTIPDILREVAEHSCTAAYLYARYGKSGEAEHRMAFLGATMDAKSALLRVESLITASLERGAA